MEGSRMKPDTLRSLIVAIYTVYDQYPDVPERSRSTSYSENSLRNTRAPTIQAKPGIDIKGFVPLADAPSQTAGRL